MNVDLKQILSNLTPKDCLMIIGYGVTGQALADFFDSRDLRYFVADDQVVVTRSSSCFCGQIHIDIHNSLSVRQKAISPDRIVAFFPSPGVSLTHPMIQLAYHYQIPVVSELELASYYLKGELIAVTGTNGKSTTVKLIDALLKGAGMSVGLKGNIGTPLITAVNEPPQSFYVVEESSYQLELVGSLRHNIALCLNVTSDHLDRYPDMQAYTEAKANIFRNSTSNDVFIFNHDDLHCQKMVERCRAKKLAFSLVHALTEGAFLERDDLVIRLQGQELRFALKNCSLKGLQNAENILASLLAVLYLRHDEASVLSYRKTLAGFCGLPHRMEKVASVSNVDYIDDSKATNVGSVVMALTNFDQGVILIAGGRDKFGDYSPLKGLIRSKVKKLILFGEAKEKMAGIFRHDTEVVVVADMKAAVVIAKKEACPGDTVLLSPACSSFDQYKNYHERGLDFQRCVGVTANNSSDQMG